MKKFFLAAVGLLIAALACQALVSSYASAQAPAAGNQPPDLFGPADSPFGDNAENVVPPDSPLRNGARGNQPVPPAAPPGDAERDPTMVSPDVRNILDPPTQSTARTQAPMPKLSGRVSLASGKTMAVIEIEGNYWIVEEGDRIDFSLGNRGVETLTIVSLTSSRVQVKFEQEDQMFLLR